MTSISRISRIPAAEPTPEIDLFGVLYALWQQKKTIAVCVLLSIVISFMYAVLAKPHYRVQSTLRAPAINDLDALNQSGVYSLSPQDSLTRVAAALDSYDVRRGYFQSQPELIAVYGGPGVSVEQAFAQFNQRALKVLRPEAGDRISASDYVGVQMEYAEGLKGDQILNGFVAYAVDRERQLISQDLEVIIANRIAEVDVKLSSARAIYEASKSKDIANLLEQDKLRRAELQDELKALRTQMKTLREDRIAVLNEAIQIAQTLGLKKPSTPSSMTSDVSGSNIIRTEVNNQQLPLYFLGTDALEAERKALRARTNDDFSNPRVAEIARDLQLLGSNRRIELLKQRQNEDVFLNEIESLRAELARLSNIKVNMQSVRLVSVDEQAFAPLSPIGPGRAMVVLGGVVFGLVAGIVMALMQSLWQAGRRQYLALQVDGAS